MTNLPFGVILKVLELALCLLISENIFLNVLKRICGLSLNIGKNLSYNAACVSEL